MITGGIHPPPLAASQSPLNFVSACGENYVHSLCSAFPHATRSAGLARGPQIGLAEKKTGRTRKGYAASVSGKAANGCAVDGPKEKIAAAGRSAQARTSGRRRGRLALPCGSQGRKRVSLGDDVCPGKSRILCSFSFRWRYSGNLPGIPF